MYIISACNQYPQQFLLRVFDCIDFPAGFEPAKQVTKTEHFARETAEDARQNDTAQCECFPRGKVY